MKDKINPTMKVRKLENNADLYRLIPGNKVRVHEGSDTLSSLFTFEERTSDGYFAFMELTNNGTNDVIISHRNFPRNILCGDKIYIRNGHCHAYFPGMECYKEKLNLINGVL